MGIGTQQQEQPMGTGTQQAEQALWRSLLRSAGQHIRQRRYPAPKKTKENFAETWNGANNVIIWLSTFYHNASVATLPLKR